MKKFFMYAVCAAFAGLTSCSSDEEFVNVYNPANESSETPIMLAMSKSNIDFTTRGTGAVGDDNNKWRGEKLNVYMLNSETFELATGYNDEPIFENAEITAPASTDHSNIYANYGISKYYPMSGNYNFFMYHADDAATAAPAKNAEGDMYILPITIDGSQDIMISKADMPAAQKSAFEALPEVGTANAHRYYSAFSARRKIGINGQPDELGIQPHFVLQHLLSRIVFYIQPNDEKVSDKNTDGTNYYGVTIESVKIKNVKTSAEFVVAWNGATPAKFIQNETNPTDVTLKELVAGETEAHALQPFTPVKPVWDTVENKAVSTKVGESLMLFPADEYELEINMSQKPSADRDPINFTHRQILRVPAAAGKFEAGKQYNVKFVVYGAEKIDFSLELTNWEEGGDIDASFETKE